MPRKPFFLFAAMLGAVGVASPSAAQVQVGNWTERPDARAPAGVNQDAILEPFTYEVRYNVEFRSYEGLKVGTEDIPAVLVLQDWDLAPISMATQRHELEVRAGLLDWLGASLRVPFRTTSAEFVNEQFRGTPSASGLGDIEVRALLEMHDTWPYRAHVSAGVSIPTGSVEEVGQLPDGPVGGPDRTLPYPMQPGDGTFAILPGAVLVTENDFGTVGIQGEARIPVGENDRGWTRGAGLTAQVWMAYRFTDWVSGSARVSYQRTGDLSGSDNSLFAFSSPLAHPDLQSGTRIELPVGVNFRFPDGRLQGHRLHVELIIPAHQDLDGPQLKPATGAAISWGFAF
jgi:hypothetical protein